MPGRRVETGTSAVVVVTTTLPSAAMRRGEVANLLRLIVREAERGHATTKLQAGHVGQGRAVGLGALGEVLHRQAGHHVGLLSMAAQHQQRQCGQRKDPSFHFGFYYY